MNFEEKNDGDNTLTNTGISDSISDNKNEIPSETAVTSAQRKFLIDNFREYRYKNQPSERNFFMNHHTAVIWVLFTLSAVIFISCIVYDSLQGTSDIASNGVIYEETEDDEPRPELTLSDSGEQYSTEGVASAVRPSVVEIYTYTDKKYEIPLGTGSGIVMTDDGYIITNAHVLEGAESYTAITHTGEEYEVSVVGKDNKTDIAVIKISDAPELVPAQFGNSDDVKLGEQVMAIGNPCGLTGSVTGGYVSGLNRKIKADATGFEMDCIQTDAAISPGNSGGALVNMHGQVIGITSSKYVSSSYEGIGFAITINEAKPVIDELIANGYIAGRFKIGISFYDIAYAPVIFAEETGFDYPEDMEGVLIGGLDEECDISETEIQPWDFITEVEGQKVYDYDTIMSALEGKKANDKVKAHVVRITDNDGGKEEFDIEFTLIPDTSGNY